MGSPVLLKKLVSAQPPSRGTITPITAITAEATPHFFSSCTSVSRPALNISTITPISATLLIRLVSPIHPRQAGPSISPASSAPTTWGIWMRRVKSPKSLVLSNMIAMSNKYLTSIPFSLFLSRFKPELLYYRCFLKSSTISANKYGVLFIKFVVSTHFPIGSKPRRIPSPHRFFPAG